MPDWQPMNDAPKDGREVLLFIPYDPELYDEEECIDYGMWSKRLNCWRYRGDDGPHDIQPTKWAAT